MKIWKIAQDSSKQNHHIAIYNGKEVLIDYVSDPKREFQIACYRVRDNIPNGAVGYVLTPDGKKYEISTTSRKAKLVQP